MTDAPPTISPEPIEDVGVHSARVPLIAFVNDRDTLAILTDVLAPALSPTAAFRLADITEMRAGLHRLDTPVASVLLDVSRQSNPLNVLEELSLFIEPGVRVFVLGDVEDMEFYRHVVRGLGAQEYLCKPITRDMAARRLLPLLTGGQTTTARSGQVIAVTGVRGGVGATTIAVNLAVQLADHSRHHILLVDANLHGGAAPLMLSAKVGGGFRAALENPDRVDALFAERTTPAISDRLHLLAAEEPLNTPVEVQAGGASHLISLLSNRFNFLVVDLPSLATPLIHELRSLAHVHILVMDPTLPALKQTLRQMSLPRGPHQASRSIIVLNQLGAPGALTRKQVVEGLGRDVDVVVPWLPKPLQMATTLGEPAVRRKGLFRLSIERLANEILPQRGEAPKARSRSWLPWSKA